jgi:hypothetical protein
MGSDTVSPGHNKGQPFILKGVDTISGQKKMDLLISFQTLEQ